jgi:hypothetical protein
VRTRLMLVSGTFIATVVLAMVVGTASARRFELSEQRMKMVWRELGFTGGGVTVKCRVTLEGSFHSRTTSKVSGQLVGYITVATLAPESCTGGSSRLLSETLPWHWRYDSFAGALPNITRIKYQVIGLRVQAEISSVTCLYASTAREPFFMTALVGLGLFETESGSAIPRSSGSAFCPSSVTPSGAGFTTVPGGEEPIFVRLVA